MSCIAPGLESDTLISGSWDKTAILWKLDGSAAATQKKLEGHEAAVWAVTTLVSGKYVTGAADKNIIYWSNTGEKLKVLKGSKDCIRGLLGLPDNSLISTGNDAVIRYWNEDGECIRELSGHTNYIYSIAFNTALGENIIVTSSEDSTIRMWNTEGELGNAITLPAQTVWSVTCMKNGDIVTGSSDGIIRVFTRDASRVADEAAMTSFNQAVDIRIREASTSLGGVKVNDLPGPEALLQKGKTNGQTIMVRQPNGAIICYEWTDHQWEEVGDVVGASGGSQETSGKTLYNGKEYDFVFSIDIADDAPPLKLPYNRNEDPWHVAQHFIHQHSLPQAYLDQISNFIMTNASITPVMETSQSSQFADPFTGEGRYIPGSGSNFNQSGGNVDPFTGGSSYSTSAASVPVNFVQGGRGSSGAKHFPFNHYTTLDNCDAEKVLKKLKEFNARVVDEKKVTDEEMELAIKFAKNVCCKVQNLFIHFDENKLNSSFQDHTVSASIDALKKLLNWHRGWSILMLKI